MKLQPLMLAGLLVGIAPSSWAASDTQAQQLKSTLTPLGAERAGNADGSIPAWDKGFTQVPAGVNPGPRLPDYFANDKPMYSVTSQNVAQYGDKLSDGQKALFAKYPTYRIDVYPTRPDAPPPRRNGSTTTL